MRPPELSQEEIAEKIRYFFKTGIPPHSYLIRHQTGLTQRQVLRGIRELIEAGEVVRVSQGVYEMKEGN